MTWTTIAPALEEVYEVADVGMAVEPANDRPIRRSVERQYTVVVTNEHRATIR